MWIFRKCLRSEFFSFETVRKWQTYGSGRKPLSVCQHFFIKFLRKLQKFKKIALVFQKYHNLLQNRKGCTDFYLESFWINWGLSESCESCAVYLVFILHFVLGSSSARSTPTLLTNRTLLPSCCRQGAEYTASRNTQGYRISKKYTLHQGTPLIEQ